MAVSTVTQAQHRVTDASVKTRSGFWQTIRGRNAAEVHEPEPFAPDAQSRWVLRGVQAALRTLAESLAAVQAPEKPQPVQGEAALYNTHPKPQLRRLAHLALDLEADQTLGYRDCVARLRELMDEFSQGAIDEFEAQQQYERRVGRNAVVAAAQGAVLEDAARRGERIDPASSHGQQVIGDMAGRALLASDPEPTDLQVKMTPEVLARLDAGESPDAVAVSVTATAVMSPVRADAPPLPGDEESADLGAVSPLAAPLPKRVPQHRPVDVLPYTDLDPYSTVDPTVKGQGLEPGAWVFDEGSGTTGPVWFLLAEQEDRLRESGRVALLKFANGSTREVDAGKPVKVLDVRRAQVLLAEHEQALAAKAAERAA